MNHPAAAARRSKKHPPPRPESPGRNAKTKAFENITLLSGRKQNTTGNCLPPRPAPHLREFTPPSIAPPVSDALDNSFAAVATYNDSGNTGGEGGLVDLSAVETAAAAVGGGEVLSVNSSNAGDLSDDEESKESVSLFGIDVNGSPTFSLDNDQMADSPTEMAIAIVNEIEDDQFVDEALVREKMRRMYKGAKKDHTAQSLWRKYEQELTLLRTFAKKIPGIGNLAELPSGSTQLWHMKTPLVRSLWKEKNPVRNYCHLTFITLCLLTTTKML